MTVRRVVTGHSKDGKSIVASDTRVDATRVGLLPGFEFHRLWGSDTAPTYPDDGSPAEHSAYLPPLGGFRFVQIVIPPDVVARLEGEPEESAVAEVEARLPGLLGTLDPDHPGMHTTDTVDLVYVASGQLVLELDDGVEVELKTGDTVVQSGTRHRWHNRTSEPAVMVGVAVGARRAS